MENKGLIFFIFVMAVILFLVSLVNAECIGVSSKQVKYDTNVLTNFDIAENNKTLGKEVLIPITVKIKDITNITPLKSDSIEVQESKDFERKAILDNITDSILLTLSEDEFQLEGKFPLGNGFYGNITKQGFEKLLGDERIKNIYANKEGWINSKISLQEFLLGIIILMFMLMLTVLLIKSNKKRGWRTKG